jgi:hypothetical protein
MSKTKTNSPEGVVRRKVKKRRSKLPPNLIYLQKRSEMALARNDAVNQKSFCKRLIFVNDFNISDSTPNVSPIFTDTWNNDKQSSRTPLHGVKPFIEK